MKNFLLVTIPILFFGFQEAVGQTYLCYYETINKAEIAHLDMEFQKSDSLYIVAFELVDKPFKEDYFLAAVNADKLNDNAKMYHYLVQGVKSGLEFKRVKQLRNFPKSEFYKTLKNSYKELRKDYLKTLKIPLRNEISEMIRKDQRARNPILGSYRKWEKVDAYNYKRLLEIIEENGNKWPGFSTIGEITKTKYVVTDNITLLLLHFKHEQIEILKTYMLQAVMEGEMYPYHYARAIDYKDIGVRHCQTYGTYFYNDKYEMTEICDCEEANKARKEIGFESLDDYYRKCESKYKCRNNPKI